jgi:hypothetical protein
MSGLVARDLSGFMLRLPKTGRNPLPLLRFEHRQKPRWAAFVLAVYMNVACPILQGRSSMTPNDGFYEVFWPRAPRQMQRRALAPRLDSLEGKTIAQLWDQLFKGDVVFELLEKGIRARMPEVRFISWREFGSTHGDQEKEALAALPGRFKELGVDAVISGMAC